MDAFDHEHSQLNSLLKANVKSLKGGQVTQVDYKKIDRSVLAAYVAGLSAVSRSTYEQFTRDQKLAFLINTYNANTLLLIVKNYPVKSIKDLGSFLSSPWKKKIVSLFGENVSLDDIEHGMLRKDPLFQEPRIHFAVNCASVGCPALMSEAFTAAKLEGMLERSVKNFLGDRKRNRVEGTTITLSKIFDWYAEDFKKGWKGYSSLQDFLAKYAEALADSPEQVALVRGKKAALAYSEYNWSLNDVGAEP